MFQHLYTEGRLSSLFVFWFLQRCGTTIKQNIGCYKAGRVAASPEWSSKCLRDVGFLHRASSDQVIAATVFSLTVSQKTCFQNSARIVCLTVSFLRYSQQYSVGGSEPKLVSCSSLLTASDLKWSTDEDNYAVGKDSQSNSQLMNKEIE